MGQFPAKHGVLRVRRKDLLPELNSRGELSPALEHFAAIAKPLRIGGPSHLVVVHRLPGALQSGFKRNIELVDRLAGRRKRMNRRAEGLRRDSVLFQLSLAHVSDGQQMM